ncbi:dTDP-4-dehydrorhamnose reductase [Joostella atrarenae]|uniref:dTDP-4-dehydrorhamnose reductase n=1 Tax=Joostella atrarenae TaxID=679257 RepID=A0ABS9J390_9FLAO|nr:dTDP-4-dehydrorhamnose reductase [Joostella atrarenae]MCF8714893.1 dTDP-4-dehydrorhamnose reductase [Joostella atrarenae]
MIKILVTGASGQLGLTIRENKDNYKNVEFVFCDSYELDITNENSIVKAFKEHRPNYCVNCAAYTNVEQAEKEPKKAFLVNADGVKYLADACRIYNITLVHISTDYVFDGEKSEPYCVDDITNPINVYGKSKLQGELYVKESLLKYYIVRTSWLYSKNFGKNFYKTILEKARKGERLYITDNQEGCPTNTETLSNFIIYLILMDKRYGIYHFSDKERMTWYGFARKILKDNSFNSIEVIKDNSYKTVAKRPKYSILG